MAQADNTAVIIAALSFLTAATAWVFRFKIAELAGKKKEKAPVEVLFGGYEKLLKQYQSVLDEKDGKIAKLERTLGHVQDEMDKAQSVIREMKEEDARKAKLIEELELKLAELKNIHNAAKM